MTEAAELFKLKICTAGNLIERMSFLILDFILDMKQQLD